MRSARTLALHGCVFVLFVSSSFFFCEVLFEEVFTGVVAKVVTNVFAIGHPIHKYIYINMFMFKCINK